MSRAFNLPTAAARTSEVGLTWVEVLSGAAGTIEVQKRSALRVRATAGVTVTIDGVLAATMISGEILIFNVGSGARDDTKETVTVVIAGTCFAQVGQERERDPQ